MAYSLITLLHYLKNDYGTSVRTMVPNGTTMVLHTTWYEYQWYQHGTRVRTRVPMVYVYVPYLVPRCSRF